MSSEFLFQAVVYLAAAVFSVPLAKRLGLGSVLGYLGAGVVIGPFGLALVGGHGQDVMHFAEFGVVMMLFLVGLELNPAMLWRMRATFLGLGGLQVSLTTLAVALVGAVAGLRWQAALAIGLILAMSSTAIALQTLGEKGWLKNAGGQAAFAVLLFQDLAVIPILAILPLLALEVTSTASAAGHTTWVAGLPGWAQTGVVLGAVAAIVVVGKFLVEPFFRMIARAGLHEIFTAAALLLVVATALVMSQVGLSPALGTFVAGVVLANSAFRHELESDIEPFKAILLGLFFIAVGAAIDLGLFAAQPLLIAALVLALIAIKLGVLVGVGRLFKLSLSQNLLFGFALAQGGEFAFVLFSFAVQSRVLTTVEAGPLTAALAASMMASPLLMLAYERLLLPRLAPAAPPARAADAIDEESQVLIAGFGNFGNIVGRLLRANGISATVLDNDSDRVAGLRRLGFKVYYGDASRLELLRAAKAGQARLMVLAFDDPEKTLELVATVKRHFPQLELFARADSRHQAYALLEAGVTSVYRETLDTSLQVGVDILRRLGLRGVQAVRAAHTFRQHDEQHLRELARVHRDDAAYLGQARQRIAELEELLRRDRDEFGARHEDEAWDPSSLRDEYGSLPRQ